MNATSAEHLLAAPTARRFRRGWRWRTCLLGRCITQGIRQRGNFCRAEDMPTSMGIGKALQGECDILKNLHRGFEFPPLPLMQWPSKNPCRGLEDARGPLDGLLDFVLASGVGQTGRGPQQSNSIGSTRNYQIMSGNAKHRARSSRRYESENSRDGPASEQDKGGLLRPPLSALSRQTTNSVPLRIPARQFGRQHAGPPSS